MRSSSPVRAAAVQAGEVARSVWCGTVRTGHGAMRITGRRRCRARAAAPGRSHACPRRSGRRRSAGGVLGDLSRAAGKPATTRRTTRGTGVVTGSARAASNRSASAMLSCCSDREVETRSLDTPGLLACIRDHVEQMEGRCRGMDASSHATRRASSDVSLKSMAATMVRKTDICTPWNSPGSRHPWLSRPMHHVCRSRTRANAAGRASHASERSRPIRAETRGPPG